MATEAVTAQVNGTYAPHQPQSFGSSDSSYTTGKNTTNTSQTSYNGSQPAAANNTTPATTTANIPKDEVGWYFVEQYYTTMSQSPEKLCVSVIVRRYFFHFEQAKS
jgi:hypothetical protein